MLDYKNVGLTALFLPAKRERRKGGGSVTIFGYQVKIFAIIVQPQFLFYWLTFKCFFMLYNYMNCGI